MRLPQFTLIIEAGPEIFIKNQSLVDKFEQAFQRIWLKINPNLASHTPVSFLDRGRNNVISK